ncbi:hypothetical protein ILUMI_22906 [Ignelater luminosus]|uniref:Regulatory protein zeste n=1 Tax=Ignelater luminosus TaxID=2038154 RepID=A0A8K0C9R8_IGNLU|nr:hypothetical protein ILUMI_22906 [Ignelater luminosus]
MESAKITILTRISENKEMLFGKFSETLTKEDKDKKWEEITDEAKSLGWKLCSRYWNEHDCLRYNWKRLDGFPIPESSASNSSAAIVPVVSNKPIDDVRREEESISSVSNSKLTRTVESKGVKRFSLRETSNKEQQLKIQKLKEQSTALFGEPQTSFGNNRT